MAFYSSGYSNVYDGDYSPNRSKKTFNQKSYDGYPGLCILKFLKGTSGTQYTYKVVSINDTYAETHPFTPSASYTIERNLTNWLDTRVSKLYFTLVNTDDDSEWLPPDDDFGTSTTTSLNYFSGYINEDHYIEKTTLPIFTISNDDYSAFEAYYKTGDDSGADNYSDLHKENYLTEVWLDGNFPNIYYKTSFEGQGEPQTIPTALCIISAVPTVSPVEMVRTSYNIETMNNVSYGQYSNPTAVPLVNKTPYGIAFNLNDDVEKKCQATFYIDKNGNVSDIVTTNSSDGTHTIIVNEGTPSETDYTDGSEANGFNTQPAYNKFSGANTLTKTYKLSNDGVALKALGNFLWSSTFKDNVLSLTNYPLENIISIKAMPLIVGGTSEEIKIGNVLTGINGDVVADADSIETTVGTAQVPRYFNNFIDFSEVDIMIYLPYIGFKKIDNIVAMKRSLRVKYYFDVIIGNCLASIEFKADTGDWLLYECYQGNCGIDIALTSTNRASIENGFINNALSAVSDVMSVNPVGLAKDVFNGMTQDFHSQSTGVGNPSVMNALDTKCRLIIKRPASYTPKEYGHTVGYPCYKYMNLSELSGFTQCENFICSLIPYATDGEKAEIKSLLESGIFIF